MEHIMRLTDRETRQECSVIPFQRPNKQQENVTTTSIAAVIAVTVLHADDETPEDKLLEIIEATGEIEVLDADDAMRDLDYLYGEIMPVAVNDNGIAAVTT
jgi:predicted aconitase